MSRLAAEILIGHYDDRSIRDAVTLVRQKPEALDQITRESCQDPSDPRRQLFRRAIRWLAETPDIEWEGMMKGKP